MSPPKLTLIQGEASDVDTDDNALMRRFQQGDAAAFEVLYQRHKKGVYNFCRRMLVGRWDAGEAMQEVFLRVIGSGDKWQARAKFSTWLYTIARNYCHDLGRKKRPTSLDPDDKTLEQTEAPQAEGADASVRAILGLGIEKLPEGQREVFLMRAYLDMTFPEIAKVVGQPVNTTKSRMRLAVESLRAHLSASGVVRGAD